MNGDQLGWLRAICRHRQPRQNWLPRTLPSPTGADFPRNGRRAGGPARYWRCRISNTCRRPPVRRPVAGHGRTQLAGRSGPARAGCRQRDVCRHARDRPCGACAGNLRTCGPRPRDGRARIVCKRHGRFDLQRGAFGARDRADVCPNRSRACRIPRRWRCKSGRRAPGRRRRKSRRVSAFSCGRRTCPWPPNRTAAPRSGIRAQYKQ